jgi:hypothetical protein
MKKVVILMTLFFLILSGEIKANEEQHQKVNALVRTFENLEFTLDMLNDSGVRIGDAEFTTTGEFNKDSPCELTVRTYFRQRHKLAYNKSNSKARFFPNQGESEEMTFMLSDVDYVNDPDKEKDFYDDYWSVDIHLRKNHTNRVTETTRVEAPKPPPGKRGFKYNDTRHKSKERSEWSPTIYTESRNEAKKVRQQIIAAVKACKK